MDPLDGNALAGLLEEVFGGDMTIAERACGGCGIVSAVAALPASTRAREPCCAARSARTSRCASSRAVSGTSCSSPAPGRSCASGALAGIGDSRPPAAAGVLRGALALRRGHVVASSALLMAHQACEALVPVVVGAAIDRAIRTSDGGALALWIAILAVLFAALTSCFRWGDRFGQRAAEDAGHALRRAVLARALAPAGGVGRMSGELTRIATQDAQQAGMIARAVPGVLAGVAAIVVAAVVLLGISVPLGLLVLLGLPPLLVAAHALGAPLARRAGAEQARAAAAAATATDLVHGLRVLKGIGAEAAAVERYRRVSRESLTASVRAARAEAAYQAATVILNGAFLVLVAFVAARLAVDGRISIGRADRRSRPDRRS